MSYEKEIDENSILFKLREEQEMKLKGGLYHQTQIRMAYNSNHMEGSRLTEDQTRSIYETRTIGVNDGYEKIDDIIETVNHFRCFDYILSIADKELSEDIIKHIQLHAVVTIWNDTKAKSHGELNRTETRALSGRYQGVLLL